MHIREAKKLTTEEIFAVLRARFPDNVIEEHVAERGQSYLVVGREHLVEISEFCRDDSGLAFDLLSCITGIDYPERDEIEVVYCLDSVRHRHQLTLKVLLPRQEPKVSSVEGVWRTADWQERETYDLMGVVFEGHHNLVRILCAEDWVGYPLRKDYVFPDTYHGIKNIVY